MLTPSISRVLVPTDGSETARRAVDFAAGVADRRGKAEVFVLYVAYLPRPLPRMASTPYRQTIEHLLPEEREEAQTIVDLAVARIKALSTKKPDITVTPVIAVHESPAKAILEFAEQNEIDIIGMGSRGLGEIAGIFLGSVSHKIIQGARCPVLIVK